MKSTRFPAGMTTFVYNGMVSRRQARIHPGNLISRKFPLAIP
jgi:hypothetical protein